MGISTMVIFGTLSIILHVSYMYPTCILRVSYVYPTYILRISYVYGT